MKGFVLNIEEATLENSFYRKVLYTAKNSQLVLMALQPGDEIGEEVHELDQFIRIEQGKGVVMIDEHRYEIADDFAILIPQGARHNVINTGDTVLKLYSVYAPAEHKDGTIHKTKSEEREEHFDGITSEV